MEMSTSDQINTTSSPVTGVHLLCVFKKVKVWEICTSYQKFQVLYLVSRVTVKFLVFILFLVSIFKNAKPHVLRHFIPN